MLRFLVAELLDRRQVGALEEAALGDVGVERRLEVLERQRVVQDAEVALAELRGFVTAGASALGSGGGGGVAVAAASSKKCGSAAEPPVSAKNFRRETGSLASLAIAFSGMSLLLESFAHLIHLSTPVGGRIIGSGN